ncbi:hypothetical protein EK904_005417 [Melospiza melodia maxima]|nr:hypothetical protein EK904_005417 [Melospiza melodia maxima]
MMLQLVLLAALALCGRCSELDLDGMQRVVGGTEARSHSWPSQVGRAGVPGPGPGLCPRRDPALSPAPCLAPCPDLPAVLLRGRLAPHLRGLPHPQELGDDRCPLRQQYRVVAGEHNLYSNDGTEQVFSVSRIIVHPYYNTNNVAAGYDIALFRLSSSATLNSAVQLAVLPQEGTILPNNYPCYITGWGLTRSE